MKKIDLYIIKNFLSRFFLIISTFVLIFLAVDIIDKLDNFYKYYISNDEIIRYYAYTFPWFLSLALPMTLLLSTIFCYGTLQKNNEITALKASGISLRRISVSIILIGVFFSFFSFLFDNIIVMKQLSKRNQIEKKLRPNKSKNLSRKKSKIYEYQEEALVSIDHLATSKSLIIDSI